MIKSIERSRKPGNLSISTRRCEGFNCSLEFNLRTRVSSVRVIKSEIMSRLSRDGSEMKRLICSVCNETEVSHLHILFVCTQKLIFFLKSRAYTTCLVCGLVKMQASGEKTISIFYNQLSFWGCHNECVIIFLIECVKSSLAITRDWRSPPCFFLNFIIRNAKLSIMSVLSSRYSSDVPPSPLPPQPPPPLRGALTHWRAAARPELCS